MSVRIGLVGAGTAAQHHLKSFAIIDEAELVAVADPSPEAVGRVARTFGCESYSTGREMAQAEELDAAYICSPHFARGEVEAPLAERGVSLFVEKPVARTLEVAEDIERDLRKYPAICSVGYHWRYSDLTDLAVAKLRGLEVAMAQGFWMTGMRSVPWFRDMSKSGGQILEQTSHLLDRSRYRVGEVSRVFGRSALRCMGDVPDLDIDDVSVISVDFENGAIGSYSSTCMLSPYVPGGAVSSLASLGKRGWNRFHSLTGIGERARISRDYMVSLNLYSSDLAIEIGERELRMIQGGRSTVTRTRVDPYMEEDRAFIKAVKSGDESGVRCDFLDGLRTLKLTLAAMASAETGNPVELGDYR